MSTITIDGEEYTISYGEDINDHSYYFHSPKKQHHDASDMRRGDPPPAKEKDNNFTSDENIPRYVIYEVDGNDYSVISFERGLIKKSKVYTTTKYKFGEDIWSLSGITSPYLEDGKFYDFVELYSKMINSATTINLFKKIGDSYFSDEKLHKILYGNEKNHKITGVIEDVTFGDILCRKINNYLIIDFIDILNKSIKIGSEEFGGKLKNETIKKNVTEYILYEKASICATGYGKYYIGNGKSLSPSAINIKMLNISRLIINYKTKGIGMGNSIRFNDFHLLSGYIIMSGNKFLGFSEEDKYKPLDFVDDPFIFDIFEQPHIHNEDIKRVISLSRLDAEKYNNIFPSSNDKIYVVPGPLNTLSISKDAHTWFVDKKK